MDNIPYRELVGGIIYLANTRPDLTYAASVLNRFCSNPGKTHWLAAKHVLRYLQGTRDFKIVYTKGAKQLTLCTREVTLGHHLIWCGDSSGDDVYLGFVSLHECISKIFVYDLMKCRMIPFELRSYLKLVRVHRSDSVFGVCSNLTIVAIGVIFSKFLSLILSHRTQYKNRNAKINSWSQG